MFMTTPPVASLLISAIGTEFFWIDDILFTGIAAERCKVPLAEFRSHITMEEEDIRCCLRGGGGCEFSVALATGKWDLIEEYHRISLTLPSAINRTGRGNCVKNN